MTATGIRMTAAELMRLPDNHMRHELIDGELHEWPLAGGEHGFVSSRVAGRLGAFLERHPDDEGGLFATGTGFWLTRNPDTVRAPDIAYVSEARMAQARIPGYPELAPDLVVEVVSPDDLADELQFKVDQWLRAGSAVVWVLYPATRSAIVYESYGRVTLLHSDQSLYGGSILPGFSCRVGDLFWKDVGKHGDPA
jgi:Uma2 family endonuclease